MASNDYYYGGQRPPVSDSQSPSHGPYYNPQFAASPQATPAPSYQSGYQAPGSSHPHGGRSQTGPSPFDTVFDDNAYPMNSQNPTPSASHGDVSQHPSPYSETSYLGAGAARPYADSIPLQDRSKDPEMNDHIHDAHENSKKSKSRKVRVGELGMLGANKKRIPWVVYVFTVVQIAVFIGELVRNGMVSLAMNKSWGLR